MPFPRTNLNAMRIACLRDESNLDRPILLGILNGISDVISKSKKFINQIPAVIPVELAQDSIALEWELVEDFLGVGFVACQAYITRVVSQIMLLRELVKKNNSVDLKSTSGEKRKIMRFGYPGLSRKMHSHVEVMDAFANYYKHRNEWRVAWSDERLSTQCGTGGKSSVLTQVKQLLTKKILRPLWNILTRIFCRRRMRVREEQMRKTINIIKFAGARAGSPNNLQIGSSYLGNSNLDNLEVFASILFKWRAKLADAYEKELKQNRLL